MQKSLGNEANKVSALFGKLSPLPGVASTNTTHSLFEESSPPLHYLKLGLRTSDLVQCNRTSFKFLIVCN